METRVEILKKYVSVLEKLESLQLSPSHLDSLAEAVDSDPALSDEEKEIHLKLLSRISKLKEKMENLLWLSEHLKALHEMGQTFMITFDQQEICRKAFELVSRVMDTDSFFIALYDEEEAKIHFPFSIDNGTLYEPYTVPFGEGLVSKVIESGETLHRKTSGELRADDCVRWGNPDQDTNTAILVPMILEKQVKGVISAQSYHEFAYKKEHEELLRMIGNQVIRAIETARLYQKVYELSLMDELTGIKNYRAFHQDLASLFNRIGRDETVTLIMLDSDNLKQINDLYGHHMGDCLIKRIAEAIRQFLEEGEEAYRYAGDEFMIISPNCTLARAEEKVRRIQRYLELHPLSSQGEEIPITISAGIAQYPEHTNTPDGLKHVADCALYLSKRRGKNQVTVYNNSCVL